MPVVQSRSSRIVDGHASVTFRTSGANAVTTDAFSTALQVGRTQSRYWEGSAFSQVDLDHESLVDINVVTLSIAGGGVSFELYADNVSSMDSGALVLIGQVPAALGLLHMGADPALLHKIFDGGAVWLAVKAIVPNTSSVKYSAQLAPPPGAK